MKLAARVLTVSAVLVTGLGVVILLSSLVAGSESAPSSGGDPSTVTVTADADVDHEWASTTEMFPGIQRPVGDALQSTRPGEFPYQRAACLSDAAVGGFDPTGFSTSRQTPSSDVVAVDAFLCAVRFPVSGDDAVIRPLSTAELVLLRDQIVDYAACLGASGQGFTPVLTRDEFVKSWPSVGPLPRPHTVVADRANWRLVASVCDEPNPRR